MPGIDDPGSSAARAVGCLCDAVRNNHGYGSLIPGSMKFWLDTRCPLHAHKPLGYRLTSELDREQRDDGADRVPG